MTPHKSEACRAEIEMLLEYTMIEPSKWPWACGFVMAKKKWAAQVLLRLLLPKRSNKRDAYPIPRIDESLSKLGDAKFFTTPDEDALSQRHSDLSKVDGSGFDQSNEKVQGSCDVLRG